MRNALSVVIASAAIGVLAATAAPANAESANLTIDQLEAQGSTSASLDSAAPAR